jgi:sulfur relay (sulfurtransferase) DsrC/TusE family protein
MMKKPNQLKMGMRVEQEHKKTIKFIESYVKKHKTFPAKNKIFASIAKNHISEDSKYYTKLRRMKL